MKIKTIFLILLVMLIIIPAASAACPKITSSGAPTTCNTCTKETLASCSCVPAVQATASGGKLYFKDTTACAHSDDIWNVNGVHYRSIAGGTISITYKRGMVYQVCLSAYIPGCGRDVCSKTYRFRVG